MHDYFVYLVTNKTVSNKSRAPLYVGVTNDLARRIWEHRNPATNKSFSARYKLSSLAWFEHFPKIDAAIACEKKIKGWTRAKKIALIEKMNPKWNDLSADFEQQPKMNEPVDPSKF